jgi:hypothetical protein
VPKLDFARVLGYGGLLRALGGPITIGRLGTGEGRGTSPGEVHDIALKAAETDATKRALATFGRPFGLELYRGGKAAAQQQRPLPSSPSIAANEANETKLVPDHQSAPEHQGPAEEAISNAGTVVGSRAGFHPDDTTPIPRPSHYYGRRHQNPITRHFRDELQLADAGRMAAGRRRGKIVRRQIPDAPCRAAVWARRW